MMWMIRVGQNRGKHSPGEAGLNISVIIIVRNGEHFLPAALDSVVQQSHRANEILVIDGASTDGTAAILESRPGIRVIKQSGQGIADARNLGIGHATSELIAFLDHDDIWLPDKLERQHAIMIADPQPDYCLCGFRFIGARAQHHDVQFAATPSVLLARRDLFQQVGLFDTAYSVGCDADWFTRARDAGCGSALVPEVLACKRLHEHNASRNFQSNRDDMFRIAKKSVLRQRKDV